MLRTDLDVAWMNVTHFLYLFKRLKAETDENPPEFSNSLPPVE
tara:strand:- start:506 stop:634 length:129 start_codon:yes stop_codon:yes gene_type:complete